MNRKALPPSTIFFAILFGLIFASVGESHTEQIKKILSIEAYDMLNTVPDTYLIDVRTRAEYQFIGHPPNAYLFPYMFLTNRYQGKDRPFGYALSEKNKFFVKEISKLFKKTDNLLIMGRDGTRSALAAGDLVNGGFKNVFDVTDGFEGPPFPSFEDSNKNKFYRQLAKRHKIYGFNHRRSYGWQSWRLPWTYRIHSKYIYPPDLNPPEKKGD